MSKEGDFMQNITSKIRQYSQLVAIGATAILSRIINIMTSRYPHLHH